MKGTCDHHSIMEIQTPGIPVCLIWKHKPLWICFSCFDESGNRCTGKVLTSDHLSLLIHSDWFLLVSLASVCIGSSDMAYQYILCLWAQPQDCGRGTGHYPGMEVIPSAGLVAAPLWITHALIFNTNWEQMSQGEYLLLVASPQKEHCPAKLPPAGYSCVCVTKLSETVPGKHRWDLCSQEWMWSSGNEKKDLLYTSPLVVLKTWFRIC